MIWERTQDGWLLTTQVDRPDSPESPVWMDSHIKVWLSSQSGSTLYRVRIDQRRTYQEVVNPEWIALFFGKNARIRSYIKGERLWRDKQVVVQRYGRKPRSYVIVAR